MDKLKCQNIAKGFITVASGEAYLEMAEHLIMSYRLYSNCSLPFYVITDAEGGKRLNKLFDGILVSDLSKSFMDKMLFFTDSPFDESIFIDADSSITGDMNYLFDVFEKNNSDLSAIAGIKDISAGKKGIQFGTEAIEAFNIKHDFPNFNGGIYYYKKSDKSNEIIQFMLHELVEKYWEYGLGSNGSTRMEDEPLVVVAMLKYGLNPVPQTSNIMYLVHEGDGVVWNMEAETCSYKYYDQDVHPTIIHWKYGGTETYTYRRYDVMLRYKYYKTSKISLAKSLFLQFVKYKIYAKMTWIHHLRSKIRK